MELILNTDMRDLLKRSPIEHTYRGSRRVNGLRLSRATPLRYTSSARSSNSVSTSVDRPQDIDVHRTQIDLRRVTQRKYPSAAFHAVWNIARASSGATGQVCALVSIMHDTLIQKVAQEWIEFEPQCMLAFFRGTPTSYFGDIHKSMGANLILVLDSVNWSVGFSDFASAVTSRAMDETP